MKKEIDTKLKEAKLDEDEYPIVEDWLWRAIYNHDLVQGVLGGQIKIDGIKPIIEQIADEFYCKDIVPKFKKI